MPKESARYDTNLDLFARDNPVEALRLDQADCSSIKTCQTDQNELNLVVESSGQKFYLHAQYSSLLEAELWAEKLVLNVHDVIFVYGLGLGYYYLPLKKWLAENPARHLFFLEDDPCVIRHFLHTELATEMLQNSQVIVRLIPLFEPNEEGWTKLRSSEAPLFSMFASSRPYMSALQTYFFGRLDYFNAFSLQWLNGLARAEQELAEFYPNIPLVFNNFYANILYLGETTPGYRLANAMHSIPAVLCGAGPSLTKQLPLLSALADRAFIMASGSAMNAVTQYGIIPHAGGAIDPTPAQASRQLTSFGYDVPAFYQNRFYEKAFTQWHGPLLFMPGSGAYRVSEWFEKELGIENAEQIIMGVSTTNFLLEITGFLGCSPIVLIGVDLSYTEGSRYAAGVSAHPTDEKDRHEELIKKEEQLLAVPGVGGKDVYTHNLWFFEAVCIGAFKLRHPEIICLNATEGGMEIPEVPTMPFSEAVDKYFTESWDVEGWFHGAVQNASHYKISSELVLRSMEKWKASLEACVNHLGLLIKHFGDSPIHRKIELWIHEFGQEPAYEYLLEKLNGIFDSMNGLKFRKIKWMSDLQDVATEKIFLEIDRYKFLLGYAEAHLNGVCEGLKTYKDRQEALSQKHAQKDLPPPKLSSEADLPSDFDPQLIPKASWPKPNEPVEALIGKVGDRREGQTLYFYPDGTLKAEAFYRKGKLHGPWTYYSPEGKILYRSLYIEGKKEGKCTAYYLSGALYHLSGYKGGELHGTQYHYFEDGTLKIFEEYVEGRRHGVVRLYYSNGQMKKEQHFARGKLHGLERLWDERGKLMIEASYEYGKVVGFRKENGNRKN